MTGPNVFDDVNITAVGFYCHFSRSSRRVQHFTWLCWAPGVLSHIYAHLLYYVYMHIICNMYIAYHPIIGFNVKRLDAKLVTANEYILTIPAGISVSFPRF